MMRRALRLLTISIAVLLALGTASAARAQTLGASDEAATPKLEIFGGYSYVNSNIVVSGNRISLNGASGSVAYNFNKWIGAVADFGVYGQSNVASESRSLTVSSFLFGPRVSWRGHNLVPFAQVLLGAGHATGTLYTTSLGNGTAPLGASSGFMLTAGGGVDWKPRPAIGIRIIETEYMYSQFLNAAASPDSNRQNNIRISTGIVFSFGQR
jgi:outer membrane immunogenic protein